MVKFGDHGERLALYRAKIGECLALYRGEIGECLALYYGEIWRTWRVLSTIPTRHVGHSIQRFLCTLRNLGITVEPLPPAHDAGRYC